MWDVWFEKNKLWVLGGCVIFVLFIIGLVVGPRDRASSREERPKAAATKKVQPSPPPPPVVTPSPAYRTGPNCRKGKPCGNTCIAQNKTCRM